MSDALSRYRALEDKLAYVRWLHQGLESQAEDQILDEMDGVWFRLSAQEQAELNAASPRSFLESGRPLRTIVDTDVWLHRELPPRSTEAA